MSYFGESLSDLLDEMYSATERLNKNVSFVQETTNIKSFGEYMSKVLLIDAVFLNEDRHLHNIALIQKKNGLYELCPIFDNGAGLLSDTNVDYPIEGPIDEMMAMVKSKTISEDFDVQLDAVVNIVGIDLLFTFTEEDINDVVDSISVYSKEIRERVKYILLKQKNKYNYFSNSKKQ